MAELTNEKLTDVGLGSISSDGKYTVTGEGMFDDLMEAVNAHLSAQYDLERITGSDYATVYLGATQSAMSSAVQYLTAGMSWGLIEQQRLVEVEKVKLIEAQTQTEIEKKDLITAQIAESEANVKVAEAQVEKIEAEVSLLAAKEVTEGKQQLVLAAQEDLYKEQANGFYWNAMNKWAKLSSDRESVYVSAEQTEEASSGIKSTTQIAKSQPVKAGGVCGESCTCTCV